MGGWGGARDRDVRERRWRSGGGGAGLAVPSASPPRLATPRSLAGLEMRLHLSAEDLALHLQDDSARAAARIPAAVHELLQVQVRGGDAGLERGGWRRGAPCGHGVCVCACVCTRAGLVQRRSSVVRVPAHRPPVRPPRPALPSSG